MTAMRRIEDSVGALLSLAIVAAVLPSTHLLHPQAPAEPACAPAAGLTFICGLQNPEDLVSEPESARLYFVGVPLSVRAATA
jgi:hypothetical protein